MQAVQCSSLLVLRFLQHVIVTQASWSLATDVTDHTPGHAKQNTQMLSSFRWAVHFCPSLHLCFVCLLQTNNGTQSGPQARGLRAIRSAPLRAE